MFPLEGSNDPRLIERFRRGEVPKTDDAPERSLYERTIALGREFNKRFRNAMRALAKGGER